MFSWKCLLWRSALFLSLFVHISNAHVRLVCPRPSSPRSDIKSSTVSLGKNACRASEGSELDVLEVHPGLFTIRFEETKFMIGSPFRVLIFNSISSEGSSKDEKRDVKARGKRDAVEVTTQSSASSLQSVLDYVNDTLSSINNANNSMFNNSAMDGGVDNGTMQNRNNISTGSTSLDGDSSAIKNTTNPNGRIAISTESSVPGQSSESMSESVTTKSSDKASKREPDTQGRSRSAVNEEIQSCLLMDHIPHNDQSVVGDHCSKNGNSFPLGICEESTYYVTIRIPDVFCPDCFLVVQQVEARADNNMCDVAVNESHCDSYISCARISIRPTTEGIHRDLRNCTNYLENLPEDWEYRPQDIYKADKVAVFTMDLLHGDLHIKVDNTHLHVGPLEKVEIRHNQEIVWSTKKSDGHKKAHSVVWVWSKVPTNYRAFLKQNKLVLNIVGSKKSQALDIVYSQQAFGENKVSLLHDTYSDHGWLIATTFLGPTARDPMAALPVGPCVPDAKHFLAFFEAVEAGYHGVLGMTLLENRAYITAVLHVGLGTIQSIRFKGSELVGADDVVVKVPDSFTGVVQVALDFTQQMKYIDTVQFLKTVEVKTNRQDDIMVGTLEEGFYSILRDQRGIVKGIGAFQPTQGYWMRAEIVLSDLSDRNPKVKTARLWGSHVELMDLSKEIVNCTRQFCCMETYVHEISSEFLLHLLGGHARVEVITQSEELSGQIVGSNDCFRYGGLCLMTSALSKNNALSKRVGGIVNAVVLLDRAEVLEISILLNHPEWDMIANNYTAVLTMTQSGDKIRLPLHFSWITEELYSAKEKYPLAKDNMVNKLFLYLHEEVHLDVSNGVHTLLQGRVHGLGMKECIQSKIHVVGKDRSFWSPVSSPFEAVYGVVLDYVKFIYDSNSTSIYLMESKETFTKCDFNKSKKIEATSSMGGLAIYFFKLTSPGFFYFADKDSCLSEAPAKLIVQVVKGRESLVQDGSKEEWCRTSFYSAWRQTQLGKWEPPSVGGPIVLGMFLGLTTGMGFILWQGMKMKQMPSSSASSSRNSLSHFVRF